MLTKQIFEFKKIIKMFFLISCTTSVCYANSDFQGSIQPIPPDIQKMMIGKTWHCCKGIFTL